MPHVHPTAVVSREVQLGDQVEVGPFCVLEGDVTVGEGSKIGAHVVIRGRTRLGKGTQILDGAILGNPPQHATHRGPTGGLRVGDNNVIREHVTIHAAMATDHETEIGNGNYLMAGCHVAHDCVLGNQIIMANQALLAGHVQVGDYAFVSGAVAVHQFCRIGTFAMVGGQSHITQDVLPYVTVDGKSSQVVGLNIVGLRRRDFCPEQIRVLKDAYRIVFRSGDRAEQVLENLRTHFRNGPASIWIPFIAASQRGYLRERSVPAGATLRLFQPDAIDSESTQVRRAA